MDADISRWNFGDLPDEPPKNKSSISQQRLKSHIFHTLLCLLSIINGGVNKELKIAKSNKIQKYTFNFMFNLVYLLKNDI